MNCWEKLKAGIADEVDEDMCLARTAAVMEKIDKTCLGFSEEINSLIKEYPDECGFSEFTMLFFMTDKRVETDENDKPLIQFAYGTKDKLQKLCTQAQEAIK